jgi:pantoate--beta-alanine ligase
LEGVTRPHFFRGVATVVTKLFNIIQPERAYFGQKDIQQTVVLKALVEDLHIPIDIRVVPTVRESDGLALSSRNAYLNPDQRGDALILWRALKTGLELNISKPGTSPLIILKTALQRIEQEVNESDGRVSLEYLSLVHPDTLQDLTGRDSAKGGILVGAIRLKGVERTIRLIDNVILE